MKKQILIEKIIYYILSCDSFNFDKWQTKGSANIEKSRIFYAIQRYRYNNGIIKEKKCFNFINLIENELIKKSIFCVNI
jgi:hypothetical protein